MNPISTPTVTQTMQAALIYQPGDVRYEAVMLPQPGLGEIVIKVGAALTCGTDLKTYRHGHPLLIKTYPSGFGHECAGTVYAVGEGVTQFKPGDRVVAANSAPCRDCFYCHKGQTNLCENLDLLNGAYADYLKIPARIVQENTLFLPNHVSFEAAAFCEPLSNCIRGVDACRIQPGTRVAVIGLGVIGQFLVKAAKLQGAHVTAMARNPMKLNLAQTFAGADAVLNITEWPDNGTIRQAWTPEGRGFDVVIEAVGQAQTWEQAINLVRPGGLVNLFGGCKRGTTITVDAERLHYQEITLISLFHHTPYYFRQALDWITEGQLDPTALITDRMPMSEVITALNRVADGSALKIALTPSHTA